jgi:hypothetical protein
MSYTVGERYWIPDEAEAWMVGSLKSGSSTVLEFSTDKGARRIKVSDLKNTKLETCGSHIDDNVENLVDLDELSEGAILYHVRNRFCKQVCMCVYVYVCVCVCGCLCMCMCLCVCMFLCVCVWMNMYVCMFVCRCSHLSQLCMCM